MFPNVSSGARSLPRSHESVDMNKCVEHIFAEAPALISLPAKRESPGAWKYQPYDSGLIQSSVDQSLHDKVDQQYRVSFGHVPETRVSQLDEDSRNEIFSIFPAILRMDIKAQRRAVGRHRASTRWRKLFVGLAAATEPFTTDILTDRTRGGSRSRTREDASTLVVVSD